MKKIFFLILTLFFVRNYMLAQAPLAFKYQAVARDVSGTMIVNKPISVRVGIRDLTITGNIVYQETHQITTNNFGIINITIGSGTITQGAFSFINWGNGNKYIELEIDLGSGYISIGASQLLSVPYALYAANGPQGPQGIPGIQGLQGPQGPIGLSGPQGIQGIQGSKGDSGIQGPIGQTGPIGATGSQGIQGIVGPIGNSGPQGNPGSNGISLVWLGTFNTAPISPNLNEAYYDSNQHKSFVWNGTSWQILAQDGATGPVGPKGSASTFNVFQEITTNLDDVDDTTDVVVFKVASWVVFPAANAVAKGKVIAFATSGTINAGVGICYIARRGVDTIIGSYAPMGFNYGEVTWMGGSSGVGHLMFVSDGVSKWYCISN